MAEVLINCGHRSLLVYLVLLVMITSPVSAQRGPLKLNAALFGRHTTSSSSLAVVRDISSLFSWREIIYLLRPAHISLPCDAFTFISLPDYSILSFSEPRVLVSELNCIYPSGSCVG